MRKNPHWILGILMVYLTLLLVGCGAEETVDVADIQTQAAQTVITGLTQNAPTSTRSAPTEEPPAPTSPPLPVDTIPPPTPLPTMLPEAVLADDFKSKTGWVTQVTDTYSYGFFDGGYYITVNTTNAAIWSVRDLLMTNVRLQTSARQFAGPADGYYGVTCRHKDGSNYYLLVIGSDGFYGIGKMVNGELEFIQEAYDQTGIIQSGETFNRITGECIADHLSLQVNNQTLLEVQDTTFDQGAVGLAAGARMTPGVQAQFANFVLINP